MTRKAHAIRAALTLVAALETIWAAVCLICGFDGEFVTSAVIALLCLGGVIYIDYRAHERERMALWLRYIEGPDVDECLREVD